MSECYGKGVFPVCCSYDNDKSIWCAAGDGVNKQYQKGYRFERRVKKHLEEEGWLVFRQGKSAFPDLLVFGKGKCMLVECKYGNRPHLSKEELDRFKEMKKHTNARMLAAYGKPRKEIVFRDV